MEILAILENDRALRRERVFKDPLNPLDVSDEHLLRYYRFPRQEIMELCQELQGDVARLTRRSHAIPCHTAVLVALRFYASGTFQSVIADSTGLSQSSVSRIVDVVTMALYRIAIRTIRMPNSLQEIIKLKQDFYRISGFPNVVGAIDCTHIPIKAPNIEENIYVNRKQYHSLNIQVVGGPNKEILSFCARYPGSTHDSFIWANSSLRNTFEGGAFPQSYLLGDSGYPLEPYLMTPIANPVTIEQQRYNRSHTHTRVLVEQLFGMAKSRFRCLHRSGGSLQYGPVKCAKITIGCMVLHNRCIARRIPVLEMIENDDPPAVANVDDHRHGGNAERTLLIANHFT